MMRLASFLETTPLTNQACCRSKVLTLLNVPLPKTPSIAVATLSRVRERCR